MMKRAYRIVENNRAFRVHRKYRLWAALALFLAAAWRPGAVVLALELTPTTTAELIAAVEAVNDDATSDTKIINLGDREYIFTQPYDNGDGWVQNALPIITASRVLFRGDLSTSAAATFRRDDLSTQPFRLIEIGMWGGADFKGVNFEDGFADFRNTSVPTPWYGGGAVYNRGFATFEDCDFLNCVGDSGGGAIFSMGYIEMGHCEFTGCRGLAGGAVSVQRSIYIDELVDDIPEVLDWSEFSTSHCLFLNNSAELGGAIRVSEAKAKLESCVFEGNLLTSTNTGGAINSLSPRSLEILGSDFRANSAYDGGAIAVVEAPEVVISDCDIEGNLANWTEPHSRFGGSGGAVFMLNSSVLVERCRIMNNKTNGNGGGVNLNASDLTVKNSLIARNQAMGAGGGFSLFPMFQGGPTAIGSSINIINSTVAGNRANVGGGINGSFNSEMRLVNCTVVGNHAMFDPEDDAPTYRLGGGIGHYIPSDEGYDAELANTIIANNWETGEFGETTASDLSGGFVSLGHNLIGCDEGATGLVDGVLGDQVGTSTTLLDPMLSWLGDHGGSSDTFAPRPGSPLIDAGDDSFVDAAYGFDGPPYYDQRGEGYPRILGDHVDIGAHEGEVAVEANINAVVLH